jgi:hypothetical protein
MTSRKRIEAALQHQETDRVAHDAGATNTSGVHVSVVYQLRQALGLDRPGTPVKVVEPGQMLGEVAPDLLDALGLDTIALRGPSSQFGFPNDGWKEWRLHDGTPVLVPALFNTTPAADGALYQYPQGDRSCPPCAKMPDGGWFFDSIIRQPPLDEEKLNPQDNLEEFGPAGEDLVSYFAREAERLHRTTDKAVVASFGGTSFGDVGRLPAPNLKNPKGIRDIEEWYISLHIRPDYVREVFQRQAEIAIANLQRFHAAVGDRVTVAYISGADFGSQNGLLASPEVYRTLFQPVHRQVNDWIHRHTPWKTFIHSCGAIAGLIDDIIDAGFDILNPVQCSAIGMEPQLLKQRFGSRIVFWGGGVDTQRTLPFGTEDDVRREVRQRLAIFASNGGFVFNPVHNVQAGTPIRNLLAMYEEVRKFRR